MHRGLRGYEEMERLYNSEILVLSEQQEILELLSKMAKQGFFKEYRVGLAGSMVALQIIALVYMIIVFCIGIYT